MIYKFMGTLFIIIATMLAIGCDMKVAEQTWPTEPNKFVVTQIKEREGQVYTMTTYKVVMVDKTTLGRTDFWFSDEKGKYNVGSRVAFSKIKHQ